MRVHSLEEIDRPDFWKFLEQAVAGFKKLRERAAAESRRRDAVESAGPEMALAAQRISAGQNASLGKSRCWKNCGNAVGSGAGQAQALWNHSQVVNLLVPGQREPWARVDQTAGGRGTVAGWSKGQIRFGTNCRLCEEPEFEAGRSDIDVMKMRFVTTDDLHRGDLAGFLKEHASAIETAAGDRSSPAAKKTIGHKRLKPS